jgi:hypothetical protein
MNGTLNWKPVYSEIRILPEDKVREEEARIQAMEMEERVKQLPIGSTLPRVASKRVEFICPWIDL